MRAALLEKNQEPLAVVNDIVANDTVTNDTVANDARHRRQQ